MGVVMERYKIRLIGLCLLIGMLALPMSITAQDDSPTYTVSLVSDIIVNFPSVSMTVRAAENGQAVNNLGPSNFAINGEAVNNLTVTSMPDGPLHLAIVVDLSPGPPIGPIQEVLRHYANGYYREGDRLTLVAMRNRDYAVQTATTLDEFNVFINNLSIGGSLTSYQPALEAALEQIQQYRTSNENGQILVVGSLFGWQSDQRNIQNIAAQLAIENNIRIHAIQAPVNPTHTVYFQNMAQGGWGTLVTYRNSSDQATLDALYGEMQVNRLVYSLSYDSLNGQNGTREIEIGVSLGAGRAATLFRYEPPVFAPPVVQIQNPGSLILEAANPQGTSFTPASYTIGAVISFPDGIERGIVSAALVVRTRDGEQRYPDENPFVDSSGNINLIWDLMSLSFTPENNTQDPVIRIEVIDQYQYEGASETTVPVTLNFPVVEPDEGSDGSSGGTSDSVNEAGGAGSSSTTTDDADGETDKGSSNTPWLVIIGIMGGALLIVSIFAIWQQQRVLKMLPEKAQERVVTVATNFRDVTKQATGIFRMNTMLSASSRPSAQLEILRGPNTGQTVTVTSDSFTIGRERGSGVDLDTPGYQNVSARHCRITSDGQNYQVADLDSRNGTTVNNQLLSPNVAVALPSNSIIQLGKDPETSIQFRFVIAQAGQAASSFGGKTQVHGSSAPPPAPAPDANDPWYLGETQTFEDDGNLLGGSPPAPPQQHPPAAPSAGVGGAPTQLDMGRPQYPPSPPQQPYAPPPQRGPSSDSADWQVDGGDDDWLD